MNNDVIARCHVEGASTIFIEFILRQIDRVLDDIPYTSKTLMEKLGLKTKQIFRRNYLRSAICMNLIRMTLPDELNSKNLKYIFIFRLRFFNRFSHYI